MEIDGVLNEKLLRKEDAKRKKAWFEEERREIELSPFVREYLIVRDKKGFFGTAEGRARLDELENHKDVRSWDLNSANLTQARIELSDALKDLNEYLNSKPSSRMPKLLPHAASDVYLPMTGVPSTKNSSESSSRGEIEIQPPQPQPSTAEVRQRRRAGDEGAR